MALICIESSNKAGAVEWSGVEWSGVLPPDVYITILSRSNTIQRLVEETVYLELLITRQTVGTVPRQSKIKKWMVEAVTRQR